MVSNPNNTLLRAKSLLPAIFLPLFFLFSLPSGAQTEVFSQKVALERQNSSIYSILNQISNQTGYYFVYDTDLLNSDKKVRVRTGNKPLELWLEEIIDDRSLDFHIIENHILVYRPQSHDSTPQADTQRADQQELIIQGRVFDENTRTPLPYATVGIKGRSEGIITNSDGVFRLRLSEDYIDGNISVSYLGYRSKLVPVRLFQNNKVDILLETNYISIQEVMIRYYDPLAIVKSARQKIDENYSDKPVYLLSFYREGVMKSNRFINYSEALFQIYKSPRNRLFDGDQVRLLQSRTISNVDQTDTLILKIRAGIKSSLELDFVKNIPDFLAEDYIDDFEFTRTDIVSVDGKRAYAIEFEQKKDITEPLYKGVLYIETEKFAFLGADFEVNPRYIDKTNNRFVIRRNRKYRASVEKAAYTVRYRYYDGRYYLNHVRADLHLRYRKRYNIFSNNYHVFVELATSGIDTTNVNRFDRKIALRTGRVFSDENHAYDPEFWSNYSIIAPEEHITRAISRIESKIESVVSDEGDGF